MRVSENQTRFAQLLLVLTHNLLPSPVALLSRTGGSEAAPVQNGKAWRSVNYALATLLELQNDLYDAIVDKECPDDMFVSSVLHIAFPNLTSITSSTSSLDAHRELYNPFALA